MIQFRTRTDYSHTIRTNSGTKEEPEYILSKDKTGADALVLTGKFRQTYKIIQESAKGVSVKAIIDRYLGGDNTAIGSVSPQEIDVTGIPNDLASAQRKLIECQRLFDGLSVDIRRQYDHNFNTFLKACQDGSFFKQNGIKSGIVKTKVKEVKPTDQLAKLINQQEELNKSLKEVITHGSDKRS